VLFTGQAEASIDAKERLAVPSKYRSQWNAARDGEAWMCVPWPGGILRLYTENRFTELATQVRGTLAPDEDQAALDAALFSAAERLEMDSTGRVRIPRRQLELAGLGTEVMVIGARDRLEVRDRAAWKAAEAERFNALPSLVARIEAKKSGGA
jgi:MraZ protein